MINNFVNATMKEFWSFADVGFQKFKDNVKQHSESNTIFNERDGDIRTSNIEWSKLIN